MPHAPYGYKIQHGKAIIDQPAALQLKELFKAYLSGLSLKDSAQKAGITSYHATVAKMLTNKRYLGDEYYPQLIDKTMFEQAKAEKQRRMHVLGRNIKPFSKKETMKQLRFTAPTPEQLYDDPFKQAEYTYSRIESEVIEDDDA
jgi:glutamate/tyrosine decarboxylase-like PLP-dependent enzyme